MQYTYTKSGKVGTLSYQEKDSDVKTYTYTYAKDDKPEKSVHPDTGHTNWYYDSTGKVVSFSYKKGEEKEKGYYYARNAQGDIIAVYRSEDSKLVGTYEYDLWGRLISATEGEEGVDTDDILTKNPIRYRSYYYDNETGFYNLNARYYDPEIRRFISADSMSVLMVATVSLECKNLFAYSENNPITGKDSSGGIIESAFDIVTLAGSIVDVCCHPTDPWAWAGLVGDAVDLIPVVTGVGEGIKGLRVAAKAADTVDDLHDAGNAAETVADVVTVVNKNTDTMPTGIAGGCFVEGTEIKTSNGEKCIEEIEVGDFVYAKNAETGENDWKPVVQLFKKEVSELIHIEVGNESIETTATHPFWVVGYGFKPAEEVVAGDWLENADGEILQVRSAEIEYQDTPVSVYNFEVEDWHTYYVSEEEILVHNMCAMTPPSGNVGTFRSQELLDSHYNKHGAEFGDISKEDYLKGANNLFNSTNDSILVKTRVNGDTIAYNSKTNEFGVRSTDGYIRTYFKPRGGINYFYRQ